MILEYLFFNLIILLASSAGVVMYPGARWPAWRPAMRATLLIALPFLIWDHLVTNHWWSFNPRYTMGIHIGALPIEEVLFFFVVPWSCLILWKNMKPLIPGKLSVPIEPVVAFSGISVAILAAWKNLSYTATIGACLVILAVLSHFHDRWIRQRAALVFLATVVILTAVFNGYLTARPVVEYATDIMTNWRLVTVPLEDFGYGLTLVASITILYERFLTRMK